MTTDLLNTVLRAEEVRSRMTRGKLSKATASSVSLTDIDKIYIQLFLDVEAFGRIVERKFQIPMQDLQPFQRLCASVEIGRRLKEDLGL